MLCLYYLLWICIWVLFEKVSGKHYEVLHSRFSIFSASQLYCNHLLDICFFRLRNSVSWPGQWWKPQPARGLSPSNSGGRPINGPRGKPNRSPVLHAELLLHLMTPDPIHWPWHPTTVGWNCWWEVLLVDRLWLKPIGLHHHKTELYSIAGHKQYIEVLMCCLYSTNADDMRFL